MESSDNFVKDQEILYTCGICNIKVAENSIHRHPCLRKYKNFYVDENQCFYPHIDNMEADVDNSQINNTEDIDESDWRTTKILQEEQLIEEVHKHPALWNFKLPLSEPQTSIYILDR